MLFSWPQRIGDRAYDSDPLNECLEAQGMQDGRSLRRYKRRWKVERLFAWLQNYRRILVRHDRYLENYLAFVQLGCIFILMKRYF